MDQKLGGDFKQKNCTDWKFITPADENATVTVNSIQYMHCKHCVYKRTQRNWLFNRIHTSTADNTTLSHTFSRSDDSTAATEAESLSSASTISSLGSSSSLGCSLGAVVLKTVTPMKRVDKSYIDSDYNGL